MLKAILEESIKGWVDIEGIYFKLLKQEFESKSIKSIDSLNKDLVCLTQLLKDYLTQLDISKTKEKTVSQKYIDQFISPIVPRDVIYPINEHLIKSDRYYFLNFNYTKTLSNILLTLPDEYFKKYGHDINAFVSHIHGDIDREEIVFGYGDEMDKDYKGIEDLNDNRFFENIKSFKYNKAYEYRDLLRFLNSGEYQVAIYGHSCGLSDRLLLNEVFEHDNCKSIKIYYYDEPEFTTKTMDISRHFNSNQLMRQKIIEFNERCAIPQIEE
ncbi:AbiH family protein [Winogradskyella vidalii]|uniref:AbiH family protein n=1 Tax=Winogradskyella vidalii TaxID=2615024 RepID=UPI0015C9F098|nr:AbiH family protein [Winogradskyella vidalii]